MQQNKLNKIKVGIIEYDLYLIFRRSYDLLYFDNEAGTKNYAVYVNLAKLFDMTTEQYIKLLMYAKAATISQQNLSWDEGFDLATLCKSAERDALERISFAKISLKMVFSMLCLSILNFAGLTLHPIALPFYVANIVLYLKLRKLTKIYIN